MKRNYITPEFNYKPQYGSYNMKEQSSFFSSKMLEIEDELNLTNQNLSYYENLNSEQIDLTLESDLNPKSYSLINDKNSNHELIFLPNQSNLQKENNTKYQLKINSKNILTNFLFALLKKERTFEGIKNSMTKNNNVNYSIKNYIKENVLNRYTIDNVKLYIKYNSLENSNYLKYDNKLAGTNNSRILVEEIINNEFLKEKIDVDIDYNEENIYLVFEQEKNSADFNFDYFFNIKYRKI